MAGQLGTDQVESADEAEIIRRQIDALRAHIYSHIIWYVHKKFKTITGEPLLANYC